MLINFPCLFDCSTYSGGMLLRSSHTVTRGISLCKNINLNEKMTVFIFYILAQNWKKISTRRNEGNTSL